MSTVGNSRNLVPLLPTLTPSQILIAKRTWKHVNTKGLKKAIMGCLQRLVITRPSVKLAFSSVDNQPAANAANVRNISDHAKYIMEIITRIIDAEEEAIKDLERAGACHVKLQEYFGVDGEDFEILGELLAETFLSLDGIRQSKEAGKLWRLLIASLIDQLRNGFEAEKRVHQRCRVSLSGRMRRESCFTELLEVSKESLPRSHLHRIFSRRNSLPAFFPQS